METLKYKGYLIKIIQHTDPLNPRTDYDNLGTMICFHGRYSLGDEHDLSIEQAKEIERDKDSIVLPLYLYDHSGITISCAPYSCPWDSGAVGFIYVSKQKVRREFNVKLISKKLYNRVIDILRSEVKTYDQYLTGDVWGYEISKDDEDLDSCWGFFGQEYCIEEAKAVVDYYDNKTPKQLELFI